MQRFFIAGIDKKPLPRREKRRPCRTGLRPRPCTRLPHIGRRRGNRRAGFRRADPTRRSRAQKGRRIPRRGREREDGGPRIRQSLQKAASSPAFVGRAPLFTAKGAKNPAAFPAAGFKKNNGEFFYFLTQATAQATVAPTMGLLPMPMKPIISTWAGTELEPANCASPCMRPIESVRP